MYRFLERDLNNIKSQLLWVGAAVETVLMLSLKEILRYRALTSENIEYKCVEIAKVIQQIDDSCFRMLAIRAPVASNLRFVFGAMKVSGDLSQMSVHALKIAHRCRHFSSETVGRAHSDLARMSHLVQAMVSRSLDSFNNPTLNLVDEIMDQEQVVDELKDSIFRDTLEKMKRDQLSIECDLDIVFIARHLERVADHATNIVEIAIMISSGEDIRHRCRTKLATSHPVESDLVGRYRGT
jgi:phosphate transport system protein